jgi:hypothetical protein
LTDAEEADSLTDTIDRKLQHENFPYCTAMEEMELRYSILGFHSLDTKEADKGRQNSIR